ncbi:MAG: hypothetical protein ACOYJV_02790 [Aminivibrio sp.]
MFRNKAVFLTCVFLLIFGLAGPVNARGGGFPRPESEGQAVQLDDELLRKIQLTLKNHKWRQDFKSMQNDINNSSRSTSFSFSFRGRSFSFVKFNIVAEEPVACTVHSIEKRKPFVKEFSLGSIQPVRTIIEREADTEHEIVFLMSYGIFTRSYISDISYHVSITSPKADGEEGAEPSSIPFTVSVELLEPDFVKEGKVDPEDPRASLPLEFRDDYREFVEEVERKYRLGGGMK